MNEPAPRVLIADDESGTRTLMRAALRKAGFEVTLASDGLEALEAFRGAAHELVLLDVDMPGLDGNRVCAEMRREAGALLPIVMVTGMDDVYSVERAYDAGATDFIAKPINWPVLGHRVRYLLRSYRAQLALQREEARNKAILEALPDALFELDDDGRFTDCHVPHADALADDLRSLVGRTMAEALTPDVLEVARSALAEARETGICKGLQYVLDLPGGLRWFELSVSRRFGSDDPSSRFIALSRDITERKEAENHIARLAYFDVLTGLPNRQSFLERAERCIQRAHREGTRLAILFLDLDGFKSVNDTMGHAAGDLILQWAADRLRDGLRPSDLLARADTFGSGTGPPVEIELARLGGDEFTALFANVDRPEDALAVANRIGEFMRRPFLLEGREVTLTTSVGIAMFPEDGADAATLLKHADTAMYRAKEVGRDNAQLYSAALTERAMRHLDLESSLRAALEREEFHLVYQPQIDPRSGRIEAVEALIRWTHPTRGLVSPLDFIGLAEQTGLIESIGLWVLHTACADTARWRAAGLNITVAVNLSPVQFRDNKLLPGLMNTLDEFGLPPGLLELELTEGALMDGSDTTVAALRWLREQGVRIALDDFGTGYSSLSYLTRLPIGNIKIDRSFVSGLPADQEHAAIIRAVAAMADSLGMRVTAEGVETLAQARVLCALGCDSLQGFYFSAPVTADAVPGLVARKWFTMNAQESAPQAVE